MKLREKLRRQLKDQRLIAGVMGVLLLLFTALFYVLQRERDLPSFLITNRVLLFVLWYVNVVLILIVLFVLLRNLFKLVLERRHRILGSTFKLKLVATYVGLSLIPVLLLFAIATELLQGSIDRWFNTPLQPVLERGSSVALALYDRVVQSNRRDAARVLAEISGFDLRQAEQRPRLDRRLQELLTELHLDLLAVYEGTEFVGGVLDLKSGLHELPELRREFLEEAAAEGEATLMETPPGGRGKLIWAAVAAGRHPQKAAGAGAAPAGGTPAGAPAAGSGAAVSGAPGRANAGRAGRPGEPPALVVVAGSLLEPVLAERSRRLIEDFQSYRQLQVQKDDLRASHLLIFLMVTLVILLASSWVGLHLARRVTVPIQALADGTRRISGGDLEHRVDVQADDDLGVLVDSFNRMTEQLGQSKALLEHGNRELVASNQRLAGERALIGAVLENVAAGVVSIDAEGRIFTCNDAALEMLRQRPEEVLGRRVEEAWQDPERGKLAALLREQPRAGKEVHLILGGEWKTFDAKVTELPAEPSSSDTASSSDDAARSASSARSAAGGRSAGTGAPPNALRGQVLVIEDLTELIKAQQLAAWNEAARRIAHEIKNPLTPIRLAAERVLKKHRESDAGLGRALEEGMAIIVREVCTLQGMVDEFSRFARMRRPQPARIELPRLLAETAHLYRNLKPGVAVEVEVRGELAAIWLDGEQIKRALINLLDNAVEATEAPGRVTLAGAAVDGRLEIQVADTGRGIPPEAKEKLFLPYFSTKGRGTGLGLAIVHRIVADHHGTIRVEDNVPHGTVFTLELPLG
jgi:two-component system nitrogen regulation sensor histidine kinase NtrY